MIKHQATGMSVPLCSYYLQGSCSRGSDCRFSHDCVPGTHNTGDYYARVCHYFLAGCCMNKDCKFSHSLPVLPDSSPAVSHLLSSSCAHHAPSTSDHCVGYPSGALEGEQSPRHELASQEPQPTSKPTDTEPSRSHPSEGNNSSIHRQPHARTSSSFVDLWEDQAGEQYASDHVGTNASPESSDWPVHSQHDNVTNNAQWEDEDADEVSEVNDSLASQHLCQEELVHPGVSVLCRGSPPVTTGMQASDHRSHNLACHHQPQTVAGCEPVMFSELAMINTKPVAQAAASTLSWRAPTFVLLGAQRHDIGHAPSSLSAVAATVPPLHTAEAEADSVIDTDAGSADAEPGVRCDVGEEEYLALGQTLLCYDFATQGTCEAGDDCCYVHGEQCKVCGSHALHPFNEEASASHTAQCAALQEEKRCRELECGICLETVLTKERPSDRCFGLLACDHTFCLSCIRGWRNTDVDTGINVDTALRTCPVCRQPTHYVTPSKAWPTSPDNKKLIMDRYKAAMATRDCRHFAQGERSCPFGASCHYRHAYPDGSLEDPAAAAAAAAERRRQATRRTERRSLSMAGFLESLEGLRALSVLLGSTIWDDGDGAHDDEQITYHVHHHVGDDYDYNYDV